jgi:hypothetical protein
MKKLFYAVSLLFTFVIFTKPVFASTACPDESSGFAVLCDLDFGNGFIPGFITLLFIIAVIVALVYLVWGGIKWVMSGGDKNALQAAREHVFASVIGLIVVLLVYFIIRLVLSMFGVDVLIWRLPKL